MFQPNKLGYAVGYPLRVKVISRNINMYLQFLYDTVSWNPFSWKSKSYLFSIAIIMATDDLATQGSRDRFQKRSDHREKVIGSLMLASSRFFDPIGFHERLCFDRIMIRVPIPESIHSRSAQIRSCDPDRPIAFHKRRSRSVHQIEKIRNQTIYWQLNHDINHSLGHLDLKLCDRGWMKNVRLMISIHDVIMGGVATSFMCADTESVTVSSVLAHGVVYDTTRFGHAMFHRYVYVVNLIEYLQYC